MPDAYCRDTEAVIDTRGGSFDTLLMEVHLTPDQETFIAQRIRSADFGQLMKRCARLFLFWQNGRIKVRRTTVLLRSADRGQVGRT